MDVVQMKQSSPGPQSDLVNRTDKSAGPPRQLLLETEKTRLSGHLFHAYLTAASTLENEWLFLYYPLLNK